MNRADATIVGANILLLYVNFLWRSISVMQILVQHIGSEYYWIQQMESLRMATGLKENGKVIWEKVLIRDVEKRGPSFENEL